MSAPPQPRPVFCIVADQHRDRGVAEAACAGRFTHNGVTLELGLEPDWRSAGLADDREWAIARPISDPAEPKSPETNTLKRRVPVPPDASTKGNYLPNVTNQLQPCQRGKTPKLVTEVICPRFLSGYLWRRPTPIARMM